MQIGLFTPLAGPFATGDYLETLGTAAEERGFASLWLAEHVVLFDDYTSQYPYAADGRIPAPPESGMLEPFTALSYLAAVTKQIRLGTGICLLPQRNPVYTAKEAANVDFLSGGRLDLGLGVGWLAEEFRVVNAPFEHRGARCRSYLEVMRRLWCDDVSEYKDEFYELPACRMYPKPAQDPHPPIHFGGESDAALRRVADLGQGWYGFNRTPDEAVEGIGRLEKQLADKHRKLSDVTVSISPYLKPMTDGDLERYRDAGVDQLILLCFASDRDSLLANLDGLAKTAVEPASAL
jgi:probable F420-dependent oxidoreductase